MTPREPTARRRSRRRLVAQLVLVVLAAAVVWYGLAWVRRIPAEESLAVIAHRGGPSGSGAPEGTIGAVEASIEAGADWLEFDVRRTADGVLVVLHDDTVDRTTDGTGPIRALTLAEAQALDAGGGARIPTVESIVDLAQQAGIPILPEIKDGPGNPGLTGQLLDLLRAKGYLDRSVIQAFEPETLEELRRLAPDAKACWLTGLWQFDISSPPADAAFVCPMAEMVLLNPDIVRQAHEAGRTVFAWWGGAETAITNGILEMYGVDGLIVDDVKLLVNR
jgi:glycerophosphoryl diester phosphodiesterase